MLARLRTKFNIPFANTMYKSYILPQFDYCDIVWTTCGEGNKNAFERL